MKELSNPDILSEKKLDELKEIAKNIGIKKTSTMSKSELISQIAGSQSTRDVTPAVKETTEKKSEAVGKAAEVLEILPDGYGFLRSVNDNYLPGPEDVYLSLIHI